VPYPATTRLLAVNPQKTRICQVTLKIWDCLHGDLHLHETVFSNRSSGLREPKGGEVARFLHQLWSDESGQDIAEYAVMLAVILVIVVGTIRLIGTNANNVFSQVGSSIQ